VILVFFSFESFSLFFTVVSSIKPVRFKWLYFIDINNFKKNLTGFKRYLILYFTLLHQQYKFRKIFTQNKFPKYHIFSSLKAALLDYL